MFHLIDTIFDDDTIILRVCLYLRHIITCEFQRGVGSQKCVMDSEQGETVRLTHQDPHLLLAEEPAKDAGESEAHPGARKEI